MPCHDNRVSNLSTSVDYEELTCTRDNRCATLRGRYVVAAAASFGNSSERNNGQGQLFIEIVIAMVNASQEGL